MNSGRLTATLKSTSKSGSPYGSFEAVLSVPTKDRDNEVIDPGAFNPLSDYITIDLDHAMSVEKNHRVRPPVLRRNHAEEIVKRRSDYNPNAGVLFSIVGGGIVYLPSQADSKCSGSHRGPI